MREKRGSPRSSVAHAVGSAQKKGHLSGRAIAQRKRQAQIAARAPWRGGQSSSHGDTGRRRRRGRGRREGRPADGRLMSKAMARRHSRPHPPPEHQLSLTPGRVPSMHKAPADTSREAVHLWPSRRLCCLIVLRGAAAGASGPAQVAWREGGEGQDEADEADVPERSRRSLVPSGAA